MLHTIEKLEARTRREPAPSGITGDCLIWTGPTAGKGYPVVSDERERYAHRLVLILDGRPPGPGEQARHSCGRSLCINRTHLAPGTQAQNEADKIAHGRDNHGKPGVTHCGKYLTKTNQSKRCKRPPHAGPCKPDIFDKTYDKEVG